MKRYRQILTFTLAAVVVASSAICFGQVAKKEKEKEIYNDRADARAEIKEVLAKAAAEHKRVIVVFGANWCYDCHVLDKAFHSAELAPILAANYEVVHVSIGKGDQNLDLMEQYEVPRKRGIPGLAVLDPDGKLIYSQKNGEFEDARALRPEDFLAFLEKWKPGAQSQ
jgi:thiol:disulfide interchange protein